MSGKIALAFVVALAALGLPSNFAYSQQHRLLEVFPEQRTLQVRSPEELPSVPVPNATVPFTVSTPTDDRQEKPISLDEAIQIAISNAGVIRVLAGVTAVSSGNTIYDVAISNTGIDQQTAVFDPTLDVASAIGQDNQLFVNDTDPNQPRIDVSSNFSINNSIGISNRLFNGATAGLNINTIASYFDPDIAPFDPNFSSFVDLSVRQPFMRGYGRAANLAPVVIARIDTERSYFQFKDSVQELVRGVIAAYWNIVAARVDVWARKQQVDQAEFAYQRALARKQQGLAQAADVAQARSALANFKAGLITARSNLILTETALLNILGIAPSDEFVLVPTTLPILERVEFDWDKIVELGQTYRPDIIELKLVLEADRQSLLQANNLARPQLDGIANYRWDGLSGELPPPNGTFLTSGRFSGFNVGVNFSVPLGLRQDRASLRRQELLLARDRVNLEQGLFQMVQQFTINYRNLDQFFEQYVAFQEARVAAKQNYENQAGEVLAGRREFINALQAITDWGNAVSQEASAITQYNTELANIERQTGTILETHGIRFVEERYGSLGPKGLLGLRRTTECYPEKFGLDGITDRYPESAESSDKAFNLEDLTIRRGSDRIIPKDSIQNRTPPTPEIPDVPQPDVELQGQSRYFAPASESKPAGTAAKRKRLFNRLR